MLCIFLFLLGILCLLASKYSSKSLQIIFFNWRLVCILNCSKSPWVCNISALWAEVLKQCLSTAPLEQMKGFLCCKLQGLHINICTSKSVFPKLAQNCKQCKYQNTQTTTHLVFCFVLLLICLFFFLHNTKYYKECFNSLFTHIAP